MSDAALIGEQQAARTAPPHRLVSEPTPGEGKHHQNHSHKHGSSDHSEGLPPVHPSIQSNTVSTSSQTGHPTTSRITTDGNIIRSDDATAHPDARVSDKLKGDLKGAINGSVGSLQAAAGVVTRNHNLEQKGLDKMSEEDARLGAKHGVMPVGSDLRNTEQK